MSLLQNLRIENTDHTENCCAACVSERRKAAGEIERLRSLATALGVCPDCQNHICECAAKQDTSQDADERLRAIKAVFNGENDGISVAELRAKLRAGDA